MTDQILPSYVNTTTNGKVILVGEDDKFYSNIYREKLKKEGYTVIMASNGEEILQKIQEQKPDLLLLDLIMPKMDGFETLKNIKANPDYQKIKVVVVSNLGQQEDIEKAKTLGADDYLIKINMSIQEMVEKIKQYLAN